MKYSSRLSILLMCTASLIFCLTVLQPLARRYSSTDYSLRYNGEFVDVVSEAAFAQHSKASDKISIRKVNENGHAIVTELVAYDTSGNAIHIRYPRVVYNDAEYVLRFEDDVMTGYTKVPLLDSPLSLHYDVKWREDYDASKALLNKYQAQVQALT